MVNRGMCDKPQQVLENEWLQLQANSVVPLQQSFEYGEICRLLGSDVVRVKSVQSEQLAYVQFIVRSALGGRRLALASRGPILSESSTMRPSYWKRVRSELGLAKIGAVIATSETPEALAHLPIMTRATVADVEIVKCELAQREKMHGKWRNRLVRTEKDGVNVQVRVVTDRLLAQLFRLEQCQQKLRGYRNLPPRFLQQWARLYPDQTYILTTGTETKLDAVMVFLRHGTCATYHFGWRIAALSTADHNVILWHAMQLLNGLGVKRLDLGQIDTVNTPGIARFKLGSGARARILGKSYLIR